MGNAQLRTSDNWNEIIETLEEIQSDGSPVAIWESEGKRLVEKGASWTLDAKSGQIDFYHKGKNFNYLHNKNTTIYFKGKDKSILFKQNNILPLGEHILIEIPEKVNLYDQRGEERIQFGWDSNHFARLTLTKDGYDYELLLSIFDISPNGVALNISTDEEKLFEESDIVHLHKLGQSNLMIPLKAEVRHLGKLDFIQKGVHFKRVKLGLKFTKDLNLLCFTELFGKE